MEKLRHARLKERHPSNAVVLTQRAKRLVPRCIAGWQVEADGRFTRVYLAGNINIYSKVFPRHGHKLTSTVLYMQP